MGNKRRMYCSHKHWWHLSRKKGTRVDEIISLLEIEKLGHGDYPVDMPILDKSFRQANLIQNLGGK
jgi:hypothetical protein